MHDPELIFGALGIEKGDSFLDLGCGPGDYALRASSMVGETGVVYALDCWPDMIDALLEKIAARGIGNIEAKVADITRPLPIDDNRIDVCLISTVLHALDLGEKGPGLFGEVKRALKSGGRLAIIECKKEDMPFGPPMHMRLAPEDVERLVVRYGFEKVGLNDLGYNYLIIFIAT